MIVGVDKVANKTFDFVVIGGGTAGLLLARELSEDPFNSVLVLEAGATHNTEGTKLDPVPHNITLKSSAYLWDHKTVPQKNAGGRSIECQRGKGLGGSSAVNYMVWTRPHYEDMEDFGRLGNPGWNWDTYLKAVQKVEGFIAPKKDMEKRLRLNCDTWNVGRRGPVQLCYPSVIENDGVNLEQTFINAGFPVKENPLDGHHEGVCYMPSTLNLHKMERTYAANTFYAPYQFRKNLRVLTLATAARILTSKSDDGLVVATGVEFIHKDQKYTASLRKEVIVCAGGIQSPQILELSGIGDPEVLRRLGVPPVLDLPSVGRNVQEHIHVPVTWKLKNPDARIGGTTYPFGFSTLDSIGPSAQRLYEKAKQAAANVDEARFPGLKEQYERLAARFAPGSKVPVFEWAIIPPSVSIASPTERRAGVMVLQNSLFSRGTIHAKSKDPAVSPDIDPHYFEQGIDLDLFVEAIKYARKLATYAPLKDIIDVETEPGPNVVTDEQLAAWARTAFTSTWHTSGACSMRPKDKGGVVDPQLKVYGTQNIRVADLSVVPLQISAHTQATAYTIGQRAADIIHEVYADPIPED